MSGAAASLDVTEGQMRTEKTWNTSAAPVHNREIGQRSQRPAVSERRVIRQRERSTCNDLSRGSRDGVQTSTVVV